MDCEKIYIADEFYWRKEDFDKNRASKPKKTPPIYCSHDLKCWNCVRCRDKFKELKPLANELWRQEKQKLFIEKAQTVHPDKYGYGNVYYISAQTNVDITCLACDEDFPQWPSNHCNGHGCPNCGNKATSDKLKDEISVFIKKARAVHGKKYGYGNVSPDAGPDDRVEITCLTCGIDFPQLRSSHLRGHGCPACAIRERADELRSDVDTFAKKAHVVHDNKYTYANSIYVNAVTLLDITCPYHGDFPQIPSSHLRGRGCPMCKDKTEGVVALRLREMFEPMGFKVEHMGTRVSQGVGKMDIRITKGDVVIYVEVDGRHHFEYVPEYKSEANEVQARDLKKHIRATAKGHAIIRIDQVWVWESHVANKTEWSSRLRQTIVKLVSGVEPSIDELFLSNRPDKYFNHPCYRQMKKDPLKE